MTNKNSDEMEIEISNIQKVYNFINEMVQDITLANI